MLEAGLQSLPRSRRLMRGRARLSAGSPHADQRDPERAVELYSRLWEAEPSVANALSFARALERVGRCPESADLVGKVLATKGLEEVYTAEQLAALRRLEEDLASGAACVD